MSQSPKKADKPQVRTRTPRPDELSRETFEFIAAIDEYKRRHMRSFLNDDEILAVLFALGYAHAKGPADPEGSGASKEELAAFASERQRYRSEHGRLFPTWSEVFELLMGLGYQRVHDSAA